MSVLNIADICPASHTLGPGKRFVLWVQGCCFNCRGCISPEQIPQRQATLVEPKQMADLILSVPGTEGVTISGGEPMLQAAALSQLCEELRQRSDLSVICYTGFTLKQLQERDEANINRLLALLDVLIDGQYIPELNDNCGWRGSSNQTVHFLTSRYRQQEPAFTQRRRDVEIHVQNDLAVMVGVPPHDFSPQFQRAIDLSTGG
jgi:anaerobic ribonucleoside-triphosphate reductase activating protein